MKIVAGLAVLIASAFGASAVAADEGSWLVRARATYMMVDNGNSQTFVDPALGELNAANKWLPEFDVTYFFTKNVAAELILTYPQQDNLSFAGAAIGSVKVLPPTLTFQYHFRPETTISPYLGVGVNYTIYTGVNINAVTALGVNAPIDVDRHSWGPAGQFGVDYRFAPGWLLNLDAKYIGMSANNVRITGGPLAGTQVTNLTLNPWLLSFGVGYRF